MGLGEGGEQNAPLGRAVIGGLMLATVTTLIVVPIVYTYLRAKPPVNHEDRLEQMNRRAAGMISDPHSLQEPAGNSEAERLRRENERLEAATGGVAAAGSKRSHTAVIPSSCGDRRA